MPTFRRLVQIRIALNCLLAALLVWAPLQVMMALGGDGTHDLSGTSVWIKLYAIALVFIAINSAASAVARHGATSADLMVLIGPPVPALLLMWLAAESGSVFVWWLATYEALFVVLFAWAFQRDTIASLQAKP